MDPIQVVVDTSASLNIKCEVDGNTEIVISDKEVKTVGRSAYPLHYYCGHVKSGTDGALCIEASIFAYDSEIAKSLHNQCTEFHHPYVMRSLGYGKGVGEHSKYMFVAFPAFDSTLAEWLVPGSGATEMGRFSEQFIEVVSQTVKGLIALHDHNFCCPKLEGKHIAVKVGDGYVTVKIWNFHASNSVEETKQSWVCLALLLRQAARNNGAGSNDSLEITDLCNNMQNGLLKGLDILKHSALLTVRQKFDNVLALHFHVLVNCNEEKKGESQTEPYSLEDYLDVCQEAPNRPQFINRIRKGKKPDTFRKLLKELRDIIEHEIEYMPPEMTERITFQERARGVKEVDLEQHIRKTWPENFLKMQVWARDPSAKLQAENTSNTTVV